MPNWIKGPDGEKAWEKAKKIVAKEYGAGLKKSDSDKFYSLVTTIYKNVCKSPDYDCGIGEATRNPRLSALAEDLASFCEPEDLTEKSQPKLNKYDPGSLLGWVVYLLDKEGLADASKEVKAVSKTVSDAWKERER